MDPTSLKVLLSGSKKDDLLYVDDLFSTFLYDGNGSSQTITNDIDLAGDGGLLWIKKRSGSQNHCIQDTEQGLDKYGLTNAISPFYTSTSRVTGSSSTGFTIAHDSEVNENGHDYVSWTFRKAPGFFDVVTYTGNGTAGRTISHALGSVPGMIIVKRTDASSSWNVYHRSLTGTHYFELETNGSAGAWNGPWNNTNPTSTHFTVGSSPTVNNNGGTYVAYIFAHDDAQFGTDENESIIKCGSYSTTGNASPVTVDLGFEPQFLLIKSTASNRDWMIFDTMRGISSNGYDLPLYANKAYGDAGLGNGNFLDLTSTGFTAIAGEINWYNAQETVVYMAIRRPNKPPKAATEVFDVSWRITGEPTIQTPFVVDAAIMATWNGTGASSNPTYPGWFSRLTGRYGLSSSSTDAQYDWGANSGRFDYMNGWGGSDTASTYTQFYSFKRAPGFMDVVAYKGQSSTANHNVNHNLGVVPELIFFKRRSATKDWYTYSSVTGTGKALFLNNDLSVVTDSSFISTTPTSTVIPTNSYAQIDNQGDTYSAFLFATLPGISKVGSYSGTGYDVNVDCGFTAGPRFVLIKRTDSSGDWYLYDTLRGLTAGNDPYMFMNSNILQVTNTDYIDPFSTGFTITSSAPAALNASGGTYLFLAIA